MSEWDDRPHQIAQRDGPVGGWSSTDLFVQAGVVMSVKGLGADDRGRLTAFAKLWY